jgi:dihydroorotate dehydrogenase electron transfer subunit
LRVRPESSFACADAGSPFCPCYLAATGDCVLCSQLQGHSLCDCRWSGVCVYQLAHPGVDPPALRRERGGVVVARRALAADTYLLTFQTSSVPGEVWSDPGTFAFIKRAGRPYAFYAPMGLAEVRTDGPVLSLTTVVEALGPKTRAIVEAEEVDLRGPYWNGLFGRRLLDVNPGAAVLILARGPAQGVALAAARHVAGRGGRLTVVVDPARAAAPLLLPEMRETGARVLVARLDPPPGDHVPTRTISLDNLLREVSPQVVVSCGADWLHRRAGQSLARVGLRTPLVFTNNRSLCCGEGVCGSCLLFTADGRPVRACKTDLAAGEWMGLRGEFHGP